MPPLGRAAGRGTVDGRGNVSGCCAEPDERQRLRPRNLQARSRPAPLRESPGAVVVATAPHLDLGDGLSVSAGHPHLELVGGPIVRDGASYAATLRYPEPGWLRVHLAGPGGRESRQDWHMDLVEVREGQPQLGVAASRPLPLEATTVASAVLTPAVYALRWRCRSDEELGDWASTLGTTQRMAVVAGGTVEVSWEIPRTHANEG